MRFCNDEELHCNMMFVPIYAFQQISPYMQIELLYVGQQFTGLSAEEYMRDMSFKI